MEKSGNYCKKKVITDFCKSLDVFEKYESVMKWIDYYFNAGNYHTPEFKDISEGFMVIFFTYKMNYFRKGR